MGQVNINGKLHDASSVDLTLDGRSTPFKSISYADKLEPGMVDGAGPQAAGRTRGKYDADGASITLIKRWSNDLVERFGDGFYEKEFEISVVYRDDDGLGVITDTLGSCRIMSKSNDIEGPDGIEVEMELSVMYVLRNGKKPLNNMVIS